MLRPRLIAPGIEAFAARTPTLPPATHTNSYALGEREVLLVEPATPYDDEQRAWLEWARALPAQGRRPVAIVLTHHHPDHVGGSRELAQALGLPLWAHVETARRLPELEFARHLSEDENLLLAGPTDQSWRVLHTPGHAPGHICLFEPSVSAVIVGDMVASVGTILVEPNDGDMRLYLEQLERLAELGASTGLPAHGDPIPTPENLFRFYIAHRNAREQKILAAVRSAGEVGATTQEIVVNAYADTAQAAWPLAFMSVQAHLIKLAAEGRVQTRDEKHIAR